MTNTNKTHPFNPFLDKVLKQPPKKIPTLEELDPITCPNCGNSIFDKYYKLYRLSALKTASGKEERFDVLTYVCASCASVLESNTKEDTSSDTNKENVTN